MITGASLSTASYYLINDFKTCYDQPDFDYNGSAIRTGNYRQGNTSSIIVFSTDVDKISELAYQPQYPGDIIHYDISFSVTEVTGGTAFGRITYREDNQGNSFDYDFREVLFKRYDSYVSEEVYDGTVSIQFSVLGATFADVAGVGTIFTNFNVGDIVGILNYNYNNLVSYYEIVSIADNTNMVVTGYNIVTINSTRLVYANVIPIMSWKQNNIISNTNFSEYKTFENYDRCFSNTCENTVEFTKWEEFTFLLSNNVFIGGAYVDNSFGSNFRNNTFNDDCSSNIIRGDFYNNIITNDFDNNTINDEFADNVIDCDFQNNLIMDSFFSNNLGDYEGIDFNNNIINGQFFYNFFTGYDDFTYNTTHDNFSQNIILGSFRNNSIIYCYNNKFEGYSFNDNTIGNNFYDNTIYHSFTDNTIGNNFQNNTLGTANNGSYFQGNQIDYGFKGNLLSGNFYTNKIGFFFGFNQIGDSFNSNNIGDYFLSNDIVNGFQENFILNNFTSNQIQNGFKFNKIGNNFHNNNIDDNFGFSGDSWAGNIIGNNFNTNNIGEYFYNNNISDNFTNNNVGRTFKFNRIETPIISIDFTEYLGKINSVTFPPTSGTDGVYSNITGTSSGAGVNALFVIEVLSNSVSVVNISNSGNLYQVGDTITILSSSFGGTEDLVLTVNVLNATPMVYGDYNKTIQKDFNGTNLLVAITNGGLYITEYITQPVD